MTEYGQELVVGRAGPLQFLLGTFELFCPLFKLFDQGGPGLGGFLGGTLAHGLQFLLPQFLDDAVVFLGKKLAPQQGADAPLEHGEIRGFADEVIRASFQGLGQVFSGF